jgi:hypothetical protein
MRKSIKVMSIGISGILLAAGAAVALLVTNGSEVRAQTPLAPCACSRATPLVGVDDVTSIPGQLQPRYGIIHCQCGAATCVSQVPYGTIGIPQLQCIK